MDLGLKDKVAIVLASTSGLGLAVARSLLGEGARVAVSGRDPERLSRARQVAGNRRLVVSDIERALHTRYTVDTVAILRRRLPQVRFVWIMGADNLVQITHWRRWPELFKTVSIAIFDRPTYSRSAMASIAARSFRRQRVPARMYTKLADLEPPAWAYIRAAPHGESATRLRQLGVWPRGGATARGGRRP